MNTHGTVFSYYEGGGLTFPYLTVTQSSSGSPFEESGPIFRHTEKIESSYVDSAMDEIAQSLKVVRSGDSYFEIATANNDAINQDAILHISTYSSAISTNHGNGYEFAAQAVRYPNHKHVYVASFGNGATAPLLPEDAAYVRTTGRFTKEIDGKTVAIQSLQNLQAALSQEGLTVTRFSTDSAGGHYARGLSLAMESGQLTHGFFSETPGFVDLTIGQMLMGMLIKENVQNAKQNRALSSDPEKMDKEKARRFTQAFINYADLPNRHELTQARVATVKTIQSLVTSLQTFRRGPNKDQNPFVDDTDAMIAQHPEARLTYGVAEHDPLYMSPDRSREAVRSFMASIAVRQTPVKVALIPGMTHAYNTYFPSLYHAVKRDALELRK
jgi:hypothetical protein